MPEAFPQFGSDVRHLEIQQTPCWSNFARSLAPPTNDKLWACWDQVSHPLRIGSPCGRRQVAAMVGKGRFFVGGNWKCNETVAEVKHLVEELNAGTVPDDIEIVVAPTYIHLQMVRSKIKYVLVKVPRQDHYYRAEVL